MSDAPVVCSFESRRANEMRQLIGKHGGRPLVAPSMREVPLDDNQEALQVIRDVVDGQADCLILLTGVGTTAMLELARSISLEEALLERMAELPIMIRGPKPAAVLHRLRLQPAVRAASPNTWRELMQAIDDVGFRLEGLRVAIQEYGMPSVELASALEERGASVRAIPVYRWALPEDLEPLRAAVRATIDGQTAVTLFTSAQQVRHVLQVAQDMGLDDDWRRLVPRVASIGPTCSQALESERVDVWFEADPPKMGPLVRGALEKYRGEMRIQPGPRPT